MTKRFLPALLILALAACTPTSNEGEQKEPTPAEKAQTIIDESIGFHGLHVLDNADFSMTFRGMDYTYSNEKGRYQYTRTQTDSTGAEVKDILNNMGFGRYINDEEVTLTEERTGAYTRSVNSVIYFFACHMASMMRRSTKNMLGKLILKARPTMK